jgi:hypothetical protein
MINRMLNHAASHRVMRAFRRSDNSDGGTDGIDLDIPGIGPN